MQFYGVVNDFICIYMVCASFTVLTDHKPLEILYTHKGKPSARILKWALQMQPYDFTVKHIKGLDNAADILSRQPLLLNDNNEEISTDFFINSLIANSVSKAMTFSEIFRASKDDPVLQEVTKCLQENMWSKDSEIKPYFKIKDQLPSTSGIMLNDIKIIVPKYLQKQVIEIAHEGHQGMSKTKALLRTKVWWPGIDKDTENLISSCIPCLSNSKDSSPEP